GWQKSRDILEVSEKTKHNPGQAQTVPLFERDFKTSQSPYLEIVYRQTTYQIYFDVELKLTMKQVILKIQDGRIKAVQSAFSVERHHRSLMATLGPPSRRALAAGQGPSPQPQSC